MVITEHSLVEIVELLNENTSSAIVLPSQWILFQVAWMGHSVTNDDQMCSVHDSWWSVPCPLISAATYQLPLGQSTRHHVVSYCMSEATITHKPMLSKRMMNTTTVILSACWEKAIKLGMQQLLSRPWRFCVYICMHSLKKNSNTPVLKYCAIGLTIIQTCSKTSVIWNNTVVQMDIT